MGSEQQGVLLLRKQLKGAPFLRTVAAPRSVAPSRSCEAATPASGAHTRGG
jgi:hypothetical protein